MFNLKIKNSCFVIFTVLLVLNSSYAQLREIFRWKQIEYEDLPAPTGSQVTDYIAYNNVPFSVSRYGSRYFVTVPRRRPGIPYTLTVIDTQTLRSNNYNYDMSPRLRAFPDIITNMPQPTLLADPNRIVSVYRTRVDVCGRLWFVDTGLLEFPNNQIQVQPPAIWVIDLASNQRIRRYELPAALQGRPDGIMGVTVDIEGNDCNNAFAYIPNMRTFSIHVYSFRQNRAWTTTDLSFYPEADSTDFNVNGLQFQWTDGVFSIALGPPISPGNRWAYFHSMIAVSDYRVPTSVLKNEALATRFLHDNDFELIGKRLLGFESNMHDIDCDTGVMYYAQAKNNGVGCWNINTPYVPFTHSTIFQNNSTMIYPADLKLDLDNNILVLANKMPIFFYGMLDVNDYNFRIWQGRDYTCNFGFPG